MMRAEHRAAIRAWWTGRLGYRLGLEVLLVYVMFGFYKFVRFLAKDQAPLAFANAERIWAFQGWLGIANEASLQAWALQSTALVVLLNYYYVMLHFSTAGAFLAWVWIWRSAQYARIRSVFILSLLLSLVFHVVYPLAPPRMFPGWGFVDTMAVYGPTSYGDQALASVANQYAAMPSVHFMWPLIISYGVIRFTRHWTRWLILIHPAITLLAIVLTANHYWLDAVAGVLLLGYAFWMDRYVAQIRWRGASSRDVGTPIPAAMADGPAP